MTKTKNSNRQTMIYKRYIHNKLNIEQHQPSKRQ